MTVTHVQEKIDLIHDLTIRGEVGRLQVMLDRPIWATGRERRHEYTANM